MAACLFAGPEAVASHRAAALLLKLDGFDEAPIEISTPQRLVAPGWVVVHEFEVPRRDRTHITGIPVTRAGRTVIDLGAVISQDAVEIALECALRRRLIAVPPLVRELGGPSARRKGSRKLRRIIELRGRDTPAAESSLEVRFIQCLRKLGLPQPVRQLRVVAGKRFVARIDFAYPRSSEGASGGVGVEVEGFDPHSGRKRWDSDRARFNDLLALGWRLMRVTRTELERRPMRIARQLQALLREDR
jgi:very-short-patch-repair endonuclease